MTTDKTPEDRLLDAAYGEMPPEAVERMIAAAREFERSDRPKHNRTIPTVAAIVFACEAVGLALLIWGVFHFAPLVSSLAENVMEACS